MFDELLNDLIAVGANFTYLLVESAPWLLLGFLMAALIKAFVPAEAMYKHLGGSGSWVTVKAALIGAPLPLCSCGVVPAALGLRASGASKNATVSFLVATPETGVDSVSFTYALMGPVMAVIRPIAAVVSAIAAGLLVGRSERQTSKTNDPKAQVASSAPQSCCEAEGPLANTEASTCCDSRQVVLVKEASSCCSAEAASTVTESGGCCDNGVAEVVEADFQAPSVWMRLTDGLAYAFGKLIRDVVVWLLVGLLVAAMVQHYVPNDFFQILGDGFGSMLLMAVIGIPMYVCATASTPIAAGFLMAGVSPGAVLVFMLLGPASNIGTLFIVKNELGARALVAYLLGLVASAFAFGFLLNYMAAAFQWSFVVGVESITHHHYNWFQWLCALIFAVLIGNALVQKWLVTKK